MRFVSPGLRRRLSQAAPFVVLFGFALLLRLLFVITQPQIAPWGDIPAYAGIALGMGHWVLHGDVHPITGQLFFSRGPFLPSLYMAAFAAYFRHDFSLLSSFSTVLTRFDWNLFRLVQAGLDSATCLGVALIGRAIAGKRAGWLAGGLATAYTPFILWVGQPLREAWVAFGLVYAVWLTLGALQQQDWRWPVAAGLAWGVTSQMLPGPIGFGLLAPWVGGLAVLALRARKPLCSALRSHWPAFAAFLFVWLLRWALMVIVLGRVSEAVVGVGATGGFWNHLETSGWPPDGYSTPSPAPGVRAGSGGVLEIAVHSLRAFVRAPGAWLGVLGQNVLRLWLYPYNIFGQAFVLDWPAQVVLHRAILLFALLGLPLLAARAPAAWLACAPPLYFTVVFGAESVETRFVAVSLPLLLPTAAYGLTMVWETWRSLSRRARLWLGCLLAAAGFLCLARVPQLLVVWPALPPIAAHWSRALLAAALGLAAVLWLGKRMAHVAGHGAGLAALAIALPLLFSGLVSAFGLAGTWRAWTAPLGGPRTAAYAPLPEQVEQTIRLPHDALQGGQVYLLADFETNDPAAVVVSLNGVLVKAPGQPLPLHPGQYESFYEVWLQFTGLDMTSVRRWWEIPVPPRLLAGAEAAVIRVRIDPAYTYAWLRVHGDYPGPHGPGGFSGPRFPFGSDDTSLYRFRWDLTLEPRLDGRVALSSLGTSALRFDGVAWRADDLSADPGRQLGAYRLRLAHLPDLPPGTATAEQLRAAPVVFY